MTYLLDSENKETKPFEYPACPFSGRNANEIFGFINLKENQCALIPTNSGSNTCIYCLPYKERITEDLGKGYGCYINTKETQRKFLGNLEERQIKAYEDCGKVEEVDAMIVKEVPKSALSEDPSLIGRISSKGTGGMRPKGVPQRTDSWMDLVK